jgi:hypothetical protein
MAALWRGAGLVWGLEEAFGSFFVEEVGGSFPTFLPVDGSDLFGRSSSQR